MPARAADPAFAAIGGASTHDWSGFYLGGTAGMAWGSLGPKTSSPFTGVYFPDTATLGAVNATGVQTIKSHGIPVGLEAGYNWQAPRSPWVVGIEADIQSLRLSGGVQSGPVSYPGFPGAFFTINSAASADWLFTARPRLGFALDRWLFYATGGLAVARPSAEYAFADSGGAVESAILARTRLGYAAGGGVEVALGNNWSAKAEYLFVDFRLSSVASSNLINLTVPLPGQPFTHSVDLKTDIVRLGLNYRFDPLDATAGVAAMPVKAPPLRGTGPALMSAATSAPPRARPILPIRSAPRCSAARRALRLSSAAASSATIGNRRARPGCSASRPMRASCGATVRSPATKGRSSRSGQPARAGRAPPAR